MTTDLDSLPRIGAPAARGLSAAGYSSLKDLADADRAELSRLHGVGPKALGIIEKALKEHGLALR